VKRYGFLALGQASRWSVELPGNEGTESFITKEEAEKARDEWKSKALAARREELAARQREVESVSAERAEERRQFIAATRVEIVTVGSAKLFHPGFRKPTVKFPDGSETQFEEDTPEEAIEGHVEAEALKAYPQVDQEEPTVGEVETPSLRESRVWRRHLFLDGEQRDLPDIHTWSYFFPMESVSETLNSLAEQGWSVAHVSEDRGLYSSEHAMNMSAPLVVRYLLARD
jgi:hypothetical protein